ncbi:MAG: sodium:solute symporter [Oscillospiraceae bacterium]|nr:sodium:solute symporter [Candidatus Ruminococcus equi]
MLIKIIFLIAFFAVMIGVGIYCRKQATDVNGFVLGSRNVGPWLTAFAFGTSYFSAVIFVGYAGQFGWKYGMAATWIGIGNALIGSLLAWKLLGRRTRVMTQHLSSATMPDFFGKRFDSNALKIAAAVIIFVFLIPYTASLYNGLSRLFEMAFHIDYTYCVIGMAVLTGIYVVVGGYMATAINDFIQGIIMLFGIVAVIVAIMLSKGGISEAVAELSHQSVQTAAGTTFNGAFTSFFGPDFFGLFGVVILTSLGTWGLPQMVQKFYAIKSEKSISTGTIVSTAFAVIVAGGCYFLGGFGRIFTTQEAVDKNGFDSIIPSMLENLSPVLIGIVVILVLSASMSTLSSLVLTSGATLTLDFINPIFKGKSEAGTMTEKSKMRCMRILIVFFIAVSALLAIIQAKSSVTFIAQLMGISWGALAGAFLAPFLYGLYMKKTSKAAVWVSFILGAGIMIADMACNFTGNVFISPYFTSPINAGVLAMLANLVLVPIISLVFPNKNQESVNNIFSCFDRKVTVSSKHAIGDEETSNN